MLDIKFYRANQSRYAKSLRNRTANASSNLQPFAIQTAPDPLVARITIWPNICFNRPSIRDSRYPMERLLELLSEDEESF
jgi:hypothetical protein